MCDEEGDNENGIESVKLAVLGDSGTGKTCIITRYVSNIFDSNTTTSNGASYLSKQIEFSTLNKILNLDIWDTAGQERYRALTQYFYKDAKIFILVFDITRKESFETIKDYWYPSIKENCDSKNVIIGLAANKYDLIEHKQINEEEIKEYAKEIKAIYMETSSLTGDGIPELFYELGYKYLNKKLANKNKTNSNNKNDNIKIGKKGDSKKKKKKWC